MTGFFSLRLCRAMQSRLKAGFWRWSLFFFIGLVVTPAMPATVQGQIDPEAQTLKNRLLKQLNGIKTVWGRFQLEEHRTYHTSPTPPDPNKRINTSRRPEYILYDLFWVYDGFRELAERTPVEPKEPLPGEAVHYERMFFTGEVLLDQVNDSASLRNRRYVQLPTPRQIYLTVEGRSAADLFRDATVIRYLGSEEKRDVTVDGIEIDLPEFSEIHIRAYLEADSPHWLRGFEVLNGNDVKSVQWIESYYQPAQEAGWLFPHKATWELLPPLFGYFRQVYRTQEAHINEPIPAEYWRPALKEGTYVRDEMSGNSWVAGRDSLDDLYDLIQEPVDLADLKGEPSGGDTSLKKTTANTTRSDVGAKPSQGYSWTEWMVFSFAAIFGVCLIGFGLKQAIGRAKT